ncbi:hypothetical protein M408DRAFT_27556 [Serendipita vermifera MAFF 305830]|uniref:Uncharacterized protein n=1 Tax=Serendipita vermifera MAFF 305830 TaxID=933852 RepID=A0A0C2X324_SERVB|nr:hypothetical protein M408DRAFT_27556 [Serendipita vermifera MAFF 305830]
MDSESSASLHPCAATCQSPHLEIPTTSQSPPWQLGAQKESIEMAYLFSALTLGDLAAFRS